jgi:predicted nucleotidyltransferase
MNTQYLIPSSDYLLLEKATRIAKEAAKQYFSDEVVGVVFLGAIVRGYFDHSSDIDIAIFKRKTSKISIAFQYVKIEGIEVHYHLSDYEDELVESWDMSKRWTFSQGQIYYDPQGLISKLLKEKVPLKPEEKKWMLMSGLTLSEWYINRLTQLWVERGNLLSAHHMFGQGLDYFFNMLFALNNQLVADMKWRYFCAERLDRLPPNFQELIKEVLILHDISLEELERRRKIFMEMWQNMKPFVEQELQMAYDEFSQLV